VKLEAVQGLHLKNMHWLRTELIRIPSEDGKFQLPIRITWPLNFDPSKKYPVMINIYGGPNAGTVRDGWQFSPLNQWWAKEGHDSSGNGPSSERALWKKWCVITCTEIWAIGNSKIGSPL